jgi:hypothetical protein
MSSLSVEKLTPNERVRVWLAAAARGDKVERRRILDTARRSTVTMRELAVQERLDMLLDAATALRMSLMGSIEVGELLSELVRRTTFWPEYLDETKWPRPTVLNQYMEVVVERAVWGDPHLTHNLDDQSFNLALDIAESAKQHLLQASDAVLCGRLVAANSKAWGIIEGITQWCNSINLCADDFLTFYCQDLLDRLDDQRSVVIEAVERFARYRKDVKELFPTNNLEFDEFDSREYEAGFAQMYADIWSETFAKLSPK